MLSTIVEKIGDNNIPILKQLLSALDQADEELQNAGYEKRSTQGETRMLTMEDLMMQIEASAQEAGIEMPSGLSDIIQSVLVAALAEDPDEELEETVEDTEEMMKDEEYEDKNKAVDTVNDDMFNRIVDAVAARLEQKSTPKAAKDDLPGDLTKKLQQELEAVTELRMALETMKPKQPSAHPLAQLTGKERDKVEKERPQEVKLRKLFGGMIEIPEEMQLEHFRSEEF